jgi:hypothetical protein
MSVTINEKVVNPNYLFDSNGDTPVPPNTAFTPLAYSATPTLTNNTNVEIVCTGNLTINPPAGGTDGSMVRLWIINPSVGGTGAAINVSINASIKIPSSSSTTSPVSVATGTKLVFSMQYDTNVSAWLLVTLINGYTGY